MVEIQGDLKITQIPLNETREEDKVDIAIIKLLKSCSDELKKRFTFLEIENIDNKHKELLSHQYFFCGYPISKTNVDKQNVEIFPEPLKVRTKIANGEFFEKYGYDRGIKWILEYDMHKQINVSSNQKQISPDPKGVSGGGLWTIPFNPKVKIEETEMKLVGIMTDFYFQDDIVMATNINIVVDIINKEFLNI